MLTRWREFDFPFDVLRREVDAFEAQSFTRFPAIDVTEDVSGFVLTAELPGVEEKDVNLVVEKDTLVLAGARKIEPPKDHVVHVRERVSASFERRIALPKHVDAEAVTAKLENGILTVTLPKAKNALPRRIEVKGS